MKLNGLLADHCIHGQVKKPQELVLKDMVASQTPSTRLLLQGRPPKARACQANRPSTTFSACRGKWPMQAKLAGPSHEVLLAILIRDRPLTKKTWQISNVAICAHALSLALGLWGFIVLPMAETARGRVADTQIEAGNAIRKLKEKMKQQGCDCS